jgi:hypothetical protein
MSLYPAKIEENGASILKNMKYNGRVNIISEPSPDVRFKMQERVAVKNKTTAYREALTGTWENSPLSQTFFSDANIQILQNGLRAGVYELAEGKFSIPPQNIDNLKVIMRSTYMQYAEHLPTGIREQIERLNKIVLDYCVPTVYKEAVGYLKYCQDQSSLVMPMERPQPVDRQFKQLELKPFF